MDIKARIYEEYGRLKAAEEWGIDPDEVVLDWLLIALYNVCRAEGGLVAACERIDRGGSRGTVYHYISHGLHTAPLSFVMSLADQSGVSLERLAKAARAKEQLMEPRSRKKYKKRPAATADAPIEKDLVVQEPEIVN